MAGDLRLVSAILHANVHMERMGDLCVNIAKFVRNRDPYPADSPMLLRLNEMGERAAEMLDLALSAFAQTKRGARGAAPVIETNTSIVSIGA